MNNLTRAGLRQIVELVWVFLSSSALSFNTRANIDEADAVSHIFESLRAPRSSPNIWRAPAGSQRHLLQNQLPSFPTFSGERSAYAATAGDGTCFVRISAIPIDPDAIVDIRMPAATCRGNSGAWCDCEDDSESPEGRRKLRAADWEAPLHFGRNLVHVTVKSPSGNIGDTLYTVDILRLSPPFEHQLIDLEVKPSRSDLLAWNQLPISPFFNPSIYEYRCESEAKTEAVFLKLKGKDTTGAITVSSEHQAAISLEGPYGSYFTTPDLSVASGITLVTVTVAARDGIAVGIYNVNVRRPFASPPPAPEMHPSLVPLEAPEPPLLIPPPLKPGQPPFRDSLVIAITTRPRSSAIFYTLDGSMPTQESLRYTQPVLLSTLGSTTITAVAVATPDGEPDWAHGAALAVSGEYRIARSVAGTASGVAYLAGCTAGALVDGQEEIEPQSMTSTQETPLSEIVADSPAN
ncbi:hypothetical protein CYMTET_19664 [Cymbomonas tetramitiformis]|uniref:Cadherin-like beta sandwich domain-containing protein n=1 Tax=Cymbomonas tetramitiformis TaxID=36881 RepID=A0AAE0L501_9CHLO|nr:hypothetical protein CYMTET_19664 [Cymbomonas tetramitiformis]